MIIGSLRQETQVKFLSNNKTLDIVFEFLRNNDFNNIPYGRYEIIDGGLFGFHSVYETQIYDEFVVEAHRKYIDIQYVISGEECVGVSKIEDMRIIKEYNEEDDVILGVIGTINRVKLKAGMFVMLFPEEAHIPGVADSRPFPVHKFVVKVPLDDE